MSQNMLGKCLNDQSRAQLKLGERAYYRFHRHESVGFDAAYTIADLQVLHFVGEEEAYLHPERLQEGWTGGDEAEVCFVFEARALGQTQLTVQNLFRGELECETQLEIEVVAAV